MSDMSNGNVVESFPDHDQGGNGSERFCWTDFPMLVQLYTLNFLDQKSLNRMKQTSKYAQGLINYEYGLRMIFPNNSNGSPSKMTQQMLKGMEGKVIRSLEIERMPSTLLTWDLEKLLQYPQRLKHVSMQFVDLNFILKLFRHCPRISTFQYKTGSSSWRPPSPILSLMSLMLAPLNNGGNSHPQPSVNEEFMKKIESISSSTSTGLSPSQSLQLQNLSSLTLSMEMMTTNATKLCDWANTLYLLLTLPSASLVNLKDFKFLFSSEDVLFIKDILQILAIVLSFVLGCPTLQNFSCHSRYSRHEENFLQNQMINWDNPDILRRQIFPSALPQNVIRFLINRYGNDQLKAVEDLSTIVRPTQQMTGAITEMITQLKENSNLEKIDLTLFTGFELRPLISLVGNLPRLRECRITDHTFDSMENANNGVIDNLYNLMLKNQRRQDFGFRAEGNFPFWETLETLIYRCSCVVGHPHVPVAAVSLTKVLTRMRALKHLEVKPYHYTRNIIVDQELAADFTIELMPHKGFIFENLQVLKLDDATMLTRDIEKLKMFKNLKELSLKLVKPYLDNSAGGRGYLIQSEDLFCILTRLRKLDKVKVTRLLFPNEDDEQLAQMQHDALSLVGTVGRLSYSRASQDVLYEFNFSG